MPADIYHIFPKGDGFKHIVAKYELLGCPCSPEEAGDVVLHHRMDDRPDEVQLERCVIGLSEDDECYRGYEELL